MYMWLSGFPLAVTSLNCLAQDAQKVSKPSKLLENSRIEDVRSFQMRYLCNFSDDVDERYFEPPSYNVNKHFPEYIKKYHFPSSSLHMQANLSLCSLSRGFLVEFSVTKYTSEIFSR